MRLVGAWYLFCFDATPGQRTTAGCLGQPPNFPYFNGPIGLIPFLFKAEKKYNFSCQGTETENNKEGFCIPTSAWIYLDFFKRHCYESAGGVHWSCAPKVAQQLHEQNVVVCPLIRTCFGLQILHNPNTDTLSVVSGNVRTYFM